jgi:hypothetical protein
MIFFTKHLKNYFITFCDAAEAWQFGIQDPATPNLEGMIYFHNYLCFIILAIVIFVCWLPLTSAWSTIKHIKNMYKHLST